MRQVAQTLVTIASALPLMLAAQNTTADSVAIVLTGQTAPDSNGANFQSLGRPSINNQGTVAFRGGLTESLVYYDSFQGKLSPSGIFVASKDGISRVAGYGDRVPTQSATFTDFGDPAVNDKGQIAFMARVGNGGENEGIFLEANGKLIPIAFSGDSAPGTSGKFGTFSQAILNNSGVVVFVAYVSRPQSVGIFAYSKGELKPIALQGAVAPLVQAATFERFHGIAINGTGQVVFSAMVNVKGTPLPRNGIFTASNGVLKLIALQGNVGGDGTTLNFLTRPSISDSGDVAFLELLPQDARFRTRLVPNGIFATMGGFLSAVASMRGPATFAGNFQAPVIVQNSDGSNALLFVAWKDVPGKNGIWLHSHGALRRLVQEGDPAAEGGTYSFIPTVSASNSGYVTFLANLKGARAASGIFLDRFRF